MATPKAKEFLNEDFPNTSAQLMGTEGSTSSGTSAQRGGVGKGLISSDSEKKNQDRTTSVASNIVTNIKDRARDFAAHPAQTMNSAITSHPKSSTLVSFLAGCAFGIVLSRMFRSMPGVQEEGMMV